VTPAAPSPGAAPADDLRGKRAVVMGLGLFSGGVTTARWLAAKGARVLVTDLKDAAALAPSVRALDGVPVEFRLGGHDPADFDAADLVVASPAVPREHPLLARAAAAGARLETEATLFLARCRGAVTAVTGSNGKSTTAALLASVHAAAGRTTHLGGNIGRALLGEEDRIGATDEVVFEISSFMLEWTRPAGWAPRVAVLTNITPNHLDRHGSFEAYLEAKAGVVPPAGDDRALACAHDDPGARSVGERAKCRVAWIAGSGVPPGESVAWEGGRLIARLGGREVEVLRRDDLRLRGEFNLQNAAAAAAAALLRGVEPEAVREGVRRFRGLPHRLEVVGEAAGVLCVNDSKATTPEAALHALGSFGDAPLVLIAGGYDKKVDLRAFAAAVAARCDGLVLLGQTAEALEGLVRAAGGRRLRRAGDMDEAVAEGLALARPGSVLLLSPGHASTGMFANYEDRGDRFRAAVRRRSHAADEWACPPG
jgi:UDP-N-acetylmuramoylalanine--D-glutamate ligase